MQCGVVLTKMAWSVQLNIWLMAFNLLLPAYPLDGGRILVDLLLMCRVPVRPAAIVTVALAIIVAVLIMVWGFVKTAILTIAVSACHLASPVAQPAAHVPHASAACSDSDSGAGHHCGGADHCVGLCEDCNPQHCGERLPLASPCQKCPVVHSHSRV